MAHHLQNLDYRSTSHGGWAFSEHEIWEVFTPLIEPFGTLVYLAMCRQIPLAAVNVDEQVTVRKIEQKSCVKRSTVAKKMREVVALGMIVEVPNPSPRRASAYQLVPLRELVKVGFEELERRLRRCIGWDEYRRRFGGLFGAKRMVERFGVHWMDISEAEAFPGESHTIPDGDAESRSECVDAAQTISKDLCRESVTPTERFPVYVHEVDTEGEDAAEAETVAPETVAQRPVSTRTQSVSTTERLVSAQAGHQTVAIRKEERREKTKDTTPVVPVPGTELDKFPELPFADSRWGEPGFPSSALGAAHWVMEQDGVLLGMRSTARIANAIAEALTSEARKRRGAGLWELGKLAVANWTRYHTAKTKYALRIDNFFVKGHPFDPSRWRLPEEEGAAGRPDATLGMHKPNRLAEPTWAGERERFAGQLERRAAMPELQELAPSVPAELRELAAVARTEGNPDAFYPAAEVLLDRMELDLLCAIEAGETVEQRAEFRRCIEARYASMRGLMNQQQWDDAIDVRVLAERFKVAGVERLSLIYREESGR